MAGGEWREANEQPGENAVAGYVLAGGASSRFGSDKAQASLGGKSLLSRTCGMVLAVTGNVAVIAPGSRYDLEGAGVVADRWPGEGPLGGILTALCATTESQPACGWNLIVSCDMPFLTSEWMGYLVGHAFAAPKAKNSLPGLGPTDPAPVGVILPVSEHGLEPLCACWRTSALPKLQAAFDQGVRKVTEAMKRLRMEVLDGAHWKRFDTAGRLFWNMNTQQDYQEALRVWETERQ